MRALRLSLGEWLLAAHDLCCDEGYISVTVRSRVKDKHVSITYIIIYDHDGEVWSSHKKHRALAARLSSAVMVMTATEAPAATRKALTTVSISPRNAVTCMQIQRSKPEINAKELHESSLLSSSLFIFQNSYSTATMRRDMAG